MTDRDFRKSIGAFYTSPRMAAFVCRLALGEMRTRGKTTRILDPAVGDGIFLAAFADQWKKKRLAVSALRFHGVDIRGTAVRKTRKALGRIGVKYKILKTDFLGPGITNVLKKNMPEASFDAVIGNPPYGVKTEAGRRFGFNRDSYAAFIGAATELLADGGVLAFLVPDTWETIPSHANLRDFLRENYSVRFVINVKATHFRAAVNPCILIAVRGGGSRKPVTAADFSRIDIDSGDIGKTALAALIRGKKKCISNENWAVYRYGQNRVSKFFIGSASLERFVKTDPNRLICRGKKIDLVRIGDIAEVRHGLTTGDNRKYIFKAPGAYGNYRIADPELIVPPSKAKTLSRNEFENGFRKGRFGKRYLLSYDKGERSYSREGWLPSYRVPTRYFIDWRRNSVDEMKRLPGHRHDNPRYYGRRGITFSFAGVYCPTFRLNTPGPFDHAGCCIFPKRFSAPFLLGYLCSTPMRCLMRVFINHTVNFGVDAVKDAFIVL
ncbi:MAG: Eco57I restriction-modification methylase domain-containing protein, partial [Planctomycetota bacterium]